MNPALIILVLLGVFIIWLLLAGIYKPFGTFVARIWNNAMEAMSEEAEEEKKDER